MKNPIIFKDPNKINISTRNGRKAVMGAIMAYWDRCSRVTGMVQNVGITEFTNFENFPAEALAIIDKYHVDITELDVAYEAAFDILDLTNVKTSTFTIRDVQTGLTFQRIRDGMKAKVYAAQGKETTVTLDLYGAALGWMKTWFDDGEWWTIQDNAVEFRRKWYEAKATIMYTLIQSVPDTALTYNEDYSALGLTVLELDIVTINSAVVNLITALLDSGLGVTAGTPLVLMVPLSMKGRVERALDGRASSDNTGGLVVNYNITPYYTAGITTSATWADAGGVCADTIPLGYLTLPGRKNKLGNRMDLTLLADTDILAFAETVAGWGRYGGFINAPQWRRILSSA